MIEDAAASIRLLVLDVDGVLTDGRIILDNAGKEIKRFHVRDGLGIHLLIKAGIDVVIITGRESEVVKRRASELGIRGVHQGVKDKAECLSGVMEKKGLKKEEICVMGDDLPDIPMFRLTGMAVSVANAALEVREASTLVTKKRGGEGAVREICELILKAQGKWTGVVSSF